ncbi:dihydrolipoyllysine-residue succinyltransferase component of 2-oxoglutarate dehydrogenase mitochondrial -like protein [Brachionus plicatilis]|uniref:Dihydrolipoyllysine-residue succinyltransferase component of 2-oxoglutarate dehydrogenase complex, mitochondrial n=1 Tax=Brachionus plicatilis TaxID=10195 RepID=A0A3M7RL94_BRAPC|nr:dihydrolipoyllysine-residue succinyltransferase component of 2-oxoglutarate dehydrogenase mitochondrial -like protein [Brachionus plicatilis]
MTSRLVLNSLKKGSNFSKILSKNATKVVSTQANYLSTSPVQVRNQQASIHLSHVFLNDVITIESPVFAESISEGNFVYVKQVGESVKAGDIIANIETDKTILELKAPQDGVIEEYLVEDNSSIKGKSPAIKFKIGATSSQPEPKAQAASKPEQKIEEKNSEEVKAPAQTPVPTSMPEIPPKPQQPISAVPLSQIPVTPFTPSQQANIGQISGTRSETRVKMNRMRQTIANRLKTAQNTCAMLTTFNEINMGNDYFLIIRNLVDLRKTYNEQFQKRHKLKLGFMSAFVKASATALMDQPVVNAVIENNEIVYRDYVDISVAVATPKGLVVPVLRNVEKMNYADIEKEIAALGEKARTNSLAIEDMQGGTFTISNGGVFGSLFGTPIINLPQSAILGMHGIFDRPVAINGQVVIRPMMYIALTYDHRLIDGREATFMSRSDSPTQPSPLKFAVVCSSNQNRSMETHNIFLKKGLSIRSFGTGKEVKLPGPSITQPNVYDFSTTYEYMYKDLCNKDKTLYTQNGLLHMLERNKRIKSKPEKFQENRDVFEIIFTVEERIFDQVLEENREKLLNQPVHIINIDVADNHEDATIGAFILYELALMLQNSEDMDNEIDEILQDYESKIKQLIDWWSLLEIIKSNYDLHDN